MRITWERAAPYSGSMLKQGIFHSLPSNNMTIELVKTGELTSGGSLNGSFARIYSGTSNARDLLATVFFSSGITVNVSSRPRPPTCRVRSEEHTFELQSHLNLVCRLLLEKKKRLDKYNSRTAY